MYNLHEYVHQHTVTHATFVQRLIVVLHMLRYIESCLRIDAVFGASPAIARDVLQFGMERNLGSQWLDQQLPLSAVVALLLSLIGQEPKDKRKPKHVQTSSKELGRIAASSRLSLSDSYNVFCIIDSKCYPPIMQI